MSDLLVIEEINDIDIFKGDGLEPLLKRIEESTKSLVLDATTTKGQKEIKSIAAKIAKSKTFIDARGKEFVAELKAETKLVDAKRKQAREFLDDLKAEIRKPVTELEDMAASQKANAERYQQMYMEAGCENIPLDHSPLEHYHGALNRIKHHIPIDDIGEFEESVKHARNAAIVRLTECVEAAQKKQTAWEAEQTMKQQMEEQRVEEEKANAIEAAKLEERERIEKEQERSRIAEAQREADEQHKNNVLTMIYNQLIAEVGQESAAKVAQLLSENKINHVKVLY